jgi:hypothetical protein
MLEGPISEGGAKPEKNEQRTEIPETLPATTSAVPKVIADRQHTSCGPESEQTKEAKAAQASHERDARHEVNPVSSEVLDSGRRCPESQRELSNEDRSQRSNRPREDPASEISGETENEVADGQDTESHFPRYVVSVDECINLLAFRHCDGPFERER